MTSINRKCAVKPALAITALTAALAAGIANTATAGEPLGGCEPAWQPFTSGGQIGVGGGFESDIVFALTVWNGDLIAGVNFHTAGGQTVNHIARWDGSAWQPFTSGGQIGVSSLVQALTVWNGDLIAGGSFTTAGGQTVNRIADGTVRRGIPSPPADRSGWAAATGCLP